MKIGIDLSPLQGPHRLRGIGSVIINFMNNLSVEDKKDNDFVFFIEPEGEFNNDPLEFIDLENTNYDVRKIKAARHINKELPGRLKLVVSGMNQLYGYYYLRFGDSRITHSQLKDLDAYIQIDPSMPLPRSRRKLNKVLFLHDMIPYVLEWDYLWSYRYRQKPRLFPKSSPKGRSS